MGIESFEFAFYLSTVYGDGPKAGRPFRRREHAVLILFMKIGQRSFLPPKSPVWAHLSLSSSIRGGRSLKYISKTTFTTSKALKIVIFSSSSCLTCSLTLSSSFTPTLYVMAVSVGFLRNSSRLLLATDWSSHLLIDGAHWLTWLTWLDSTCFNDSENNDKPTVHDDDDDDRRDRMCVEKHLQWCRL